MIRPGKRQLLTLAVSLCILVSALGTSGCGPFSEDTKTNSDESKLLTVADLKKYPDGSPEAALLEHIFYIQWGSAQNVVAGTPSEYRRIRRDGGHHQRILVPAPEYGGVAPADHGEEEDPGGHAPHVRATAALGRRAARLGAAPQGRQELDHRLRRIARPRDPGKYLRGGLGGPLDRPEPASYPAAHREGTEPLPLRHR